MPLKQHLAWRNLSIATAASSSRPGAGGCHLAKLISVLILLSTPQHGLAQFVTNESIRKHAERVAGSDSRPPEIRDNAEQYLRLTGDRAWDFDDLLGQGPIRSRGQFIEDFFDTLGHRVARFSMFPEQIHFDQADLSPIPRGKPISRIANGDRLSLSRQAQADIELILELRRELASDLQANGSGSGSQQKIGTLKVNYRVTTDEFEFELAQGMTFDILGYSGNNVEISYSGMKIMVPRNYLEITTKTAHRRPKTVRAKGLDVLGMFRPDPDGFAFRISSVTQNGLGEASGLRAGDKIKQIDDQHFTPFQFQKILAASDRFDLLVERGGSMIIVQVDKAANSTPENANARQWPTDFGVRGALNESGEYEVRVTTKGTPADRLNIRRGDILLLIDGDFIQSDADITGAMRNAGSRITVSILPKGQADPQEVSLKLSDL